MELRHLRYFVAVAEELHFSRAADRLLIAQPPLSQQIKQLEREIGVQLFNRTKRKVELTVAGETFLEQARRTLLQAERAVIAAQRAQRGDVGRIVVGIVGSAAYTGVPRALQSFCRQFPGIELTLRESTTPQQVEALLDEQLDVGVVRELSLGEERLAERLLIEEELVVALSTGHRFAKSRHVRLSQLEKDGFVLFPRHAGPGLYNQVVQACQRAGFTPEPAQEASQMPTVISLVAAGLGVALVPACVQAMRWRNVVYKPIRPRATTCIGLTWRVDHRSSALRNFVDNITLAIQSAQ